MNYLINSLQSLLSGSIRSASLNALCIVAIAVASSACVRDETDPNAANNNSTAGSGTGIGGNPSDSTPNPVDPNSPSNPPPVADQVLFEQTLYPELVEAANRCVDCHAADQIPTFAAANPVNAYNQLVGQQKVDLNNPTASRIYFRAAVQRHNCGGDAECDRIAADFLAEIQSWSAQSLPPIPPNGSPLLSATTTFAEGTANANVRVEDSQIALFTFSEGAGDVTVDSSGAGNPITLNIEGMEWVEGGLRNVSGKAEASVADSQKLFDAITPVGEYTVEAWIISDNNAQDGPARVVSYSDGTAQRNFTLGQNAIYYQLRNRTAVTDANGAPALEALTPEVDTVLQHVVAVFDADTGTRIYINGQLSIEDPTATTLDWDNTYQLVLGNETTNDRTWVGVFNMVAIHNRALSAVDVLQNYNAGAGALITLRFDISAIVGGQSFVEVQAASIDDSSYLFATPTLVSDVTPVRVKNIRIAVNGNTPVAAQAFRRLDMQAMQTGTQLSPLGAVIPMDMGPEMDQLHLEFEALGNQFGLAENIAPSTPPVPAPDVPDSLFGVRTFSEINATMAALTGIDSSNATVAARFTDLRDSLPPTPDLLAFASPQQIAIQQLATTYCGEIVNDTATCNNFFGSCDIAAGGKDAVATTLYDTFVGQNIANQPPAAGFNTAIVGVLDDLGCQNGCTGATAQTALQATCTAALSSGAVTLN